MSTSLFSCHLPTGDASAKSETVDYGLAMSTTRLSKKVKDIVNQLEAELPEIKLSGFLIGIISRCYLGDPYEVHTLDAAGEIITHYKRGEILPNGMEKARSLAMMDYAFIEVYTDRCCAIGEDGSVAVIQN